MARDEPRDVDTARELWARIDGCQRHIKRTIEDKRRDLRSDPDRDTPEHDTLYAELWVTFIGAALELHFVMIGTSAANLDRIRAYVLPAEHWGTFTKIHRVHTYLKSLRTFDEDVYEAFLKRALFLATERDSNNPTSSSDSGSDW